MTANQPETAFRIVRFMEVGGMVIAQSEVADLTVVKAEITLVALLAIAAIVAMLVSRFEVVPPVTLEFLVQGTTIKWILGRFGVTCMSETLDGLHLESAHALPIESYSRLLESFESRFVPVEQVPTG